ncbi:hypothetical protein BFJ71_g16189 [Fusarium oxysporum]|nr:hypothetical protein BFJ71_g16189 [Fusarium oxysporum]
MRERTTENSGASVPPGGSEARHPEMGTDGHPEREPTFQDYMGVFKYVSKWDFLAYAVGILASIGVGITLPLLNIVFGQFASKFSDYAGTETLPGDEFRSKLSELW